MELKEGMYIRTRDGEIRQIEEHFDNTFIVDDDLHCYYCEGHNYLREIDVDFEVLKASDEPIELIEVGDYVNGILISQIWEDADNIRISDKENYYQFTKDTVKSIVTKEQFESMSYKVK